MKKLMLLCWSLLSTGDKIFSQKTDELICALAIEKEPEYPGGQQALQKYFCIEIKKFLKRLKNADTLSGTVFVSFMLDKNGKAMEAKTLRGLRPDIDARLIKIVLNMKRWKPATLAGKNVVAFKQQSFTFCKEEVEGGCVKSGFVCP